MRELGNQSGRCDAINRVKRARRMKPIQRYRARLLALVANSRIKLTSSATANCNARFQAAGRVSIDCRATFRFRAPCGARFATTVKGNGSPPTVTHFRIGSITTCAVGVSRILMRSFARCIALARMSALTCNWFFLRRAKIRRLAERRILRINECSEAAPVYAI